MESFPQDRQVLLKVCASSIHSVESLNRREAESASMFITPGQWVDESHNCFDIAHIQMSLAIALQFWDWIDPCLFMLTTVV